MGRLLCRYLCYDATPQKELCHLRENVLLAPPCTLSFGNHYSLLFAERVSDSANHALQLRAVGGLVFYMKICIGKRRSINWSEPLDYGPIVWYIADSNLIQKRAGSLSKIRTLASDWIDSLFVYISQILMRIVTL